jgi:DNA-binding transcriptional ArsR family regulator
VIAAARFVREHLPADLDQRARLVAMGIALFADRDGSARPSSRQLATATGLHPETIARAIRRLEEAGIVAVTRRDRRVSVYRFPVQDVELSTTARPKAAQASYPHLRGSDEKLRGPWAAHLESSLEKDARANGDLWISGSGWVRAPRALEA